MCSCVVCRRCLLILAIMHDAEHQHRTINSYSFTLSFGTKIGERDFFLSPLYSIYSCVAIAQLCKPYVVVYSAISSLGTKHSSNVRVQKRRSWLAGWLFVWLASWTSLHAMWWWRCDALFLPDAHVRVRAHVQTFRPPPDRPLSRPCPLSLLSIDHLAGRK